MTFVEPDGATPLDPNIEQGLAWVSRRRRKSGDIFDDAFIRTLHKKLFGDVWTWAGSIRRTDKNIGIDPIQIPMRLRMLLDDARYWAENNVYAPLEAAIRFHHSMVLVHPFPNGNGRHARIAADILLDEV